MQALANALFATGLLFTVIGITLAGCAVFEYIWGKIAIGFCATITVICLLVAIWLPVLA